MNSKPKLKNKTIWAGAVTLLAGIVATFNEPASLAISESSEVIVTAIGAVMIILHLFTSKELK